MTWTTRPRRVPITRYLIHWTGGPWTRTPEQVRATLASRNLSCHGIFGADGRFLETESADRVCLHAGPDANENSLGDEVVCPGFGRNPNPDGYPAYWDMIHGRGASHQMFTTAQLDALARRAWDLHTRFGFGLMFPTKPDGVTLIRTRLRSCGRKFSAFCNIADPCRKHFHGILGHFHVTGLNEQGLPKKRDPGSRPLLALAQRLGVVLR